MVNWQSAISLKKLSTDSHLGESGTSLELTICRQRRRHDEIRDLYTQQLAYIWMEDSTSETTRASVERKIDSFVEEGLDHATEMLSALWEIVHKDGDIKAPANDSSAVSQFQFRLPRVMGECSLNITRPRKPRAPHTGTL